MVHQITEVESWDGLVYAPREDSYLFLEFINKYCKNKKVLDMGCGSGILGINAMLNHAKLVLCADLNPLALRLTEKNAEKNNVEIKTVLSDLFSNINEDFDLIIFNPPYLPEDDIVKDMDLTGGKEGYEITLRFLKQAREHLMPGGIILLAVSTLSSPEQVYKTINNLGFNYEILKEKRFAWEKLFILKIY